MGNRHSSKPSHPKPEENGVGVVDQTTDVGKKSRKVKKSSTFSGPSTKTSGSPTMTSARFASTSNAAAAAASTPSSNSKPTGASPSPNPKLEVKIYRSYSNLNDGKLSTNGDLSTTNIRVFRRSTAGPDDPRSDKLSQTSRTMSLPRGFERSRSVGGGGSNAASTEDIDILSWRGGRKGGSSVSLRSATLSRLPSTAQTTTSGYRVKKDDFPDTEAIKNKLKQFESNLVRSILKRYTSLPTEVQLSIVPIAIFPSDRSTGNRVVTLASYLTNAQNASYDLLEKNSVGECVLCIPPALLHGMAHVQGSKDLDEDRMKSLARDVVTCLSTEAACEISRMFEYQISLLVGDTSFSMLADMCADRIMSFIGQEMKSPLLDRNTAVYGALRGGRSGRPGGTQPGVYVSVIIGMKELKWNLYDILDKPGLRQDLLLDRETIKNPGGSDNCPWMFRTSPASDPMTYGYRGQLIEYDFMQGVFRINRQEAINFAEEVSWRYDDFHRLYTPYRCLIGSKAMKRYCVEQARSAKPPIRLDRYILQMFEGPGCTRDAIQPVYRPLEAFTYSSQHVDLTNVDMPRNLLPSSTVDTSTPYSAARQNNEARFNYSPDGDTMANDSIRDNAQTRLSYSPDGGRPLDISSVNGSTVKENGSVVSAKGSSFRADDSLSSHSADGLKQSQSLKYTNGVSSKNTIQETVTTLTFSKKASEV